jgi:hypothetical protein
MKSHKHTLLSDGFFGLHLDEPKSLSYGKKVVCIVPLRCCCERKFAECFIQKLRICFDEQMCGFRICAADRYVLKNGLPLFT